MKRLIVLVIGLTGPTSMAVAQHIHLNAGALSQAQNTPLFFANGGSFVTNSGFVLPLALATNGTYAGYYQAGGLSFTAIGTDSGFLNPPAPGAQVRLRFVSVTGPAGGSFGVWDVPGFNFDGDESTALTFSLPAGATNGAQSILLSENNGEPGANPGGHIHGRHYSATVPGLYTVTTELFDASTNGTGGGRIHAPSEAFPIFVQAGVTIASLAHATNEVTITFATQTGSTYYLDVASDLPFTGAEQTIAGPLAGNNRLQTVTDANTGASRRFYRLRVTTP